MYSLENTVVADGICWAEPLLPPEPASDNHQMSSTAGLVTELERIATALNAEDGSASQFSLASVAEKIAKTLSVRKDEVAIMGVSTRWRHLHFLVPEALKNVGFIPLSSKSALAARTTSEASQRCPSSCGMYCRGSSQIGHAAGGSSLGGYCVPQALQM